MGWRTDQAYEDARREDFRKWKAALTWAEYATWQWMRWRWFLAGVAVVAVPVGATMLILS